MSRTLAETLLAENAVTFLKGSRTYELVATGTCLPSFSGQTVSLEFSESGPGAAATARVPVLRYFHAFLDFWGFRETLSPTPAAVPWSCPGVAGGDDRHR